MAEEQEVDLGASARRMTTGSDNQQQAETEDLGSRSATITPGVYNQTNRAGDLESRMTPGPRITGTTFGQLPGKETQHQHWGVPTDPAAVRIREAVSDAWNSTTGPITPEYQEKMNNAVDPFGNRWPGWINRNVINPAIQTAAAGPAAVGAGVGSTVAELTRGAGVPELGRDINQALGMIPIFGGAMVGVTPRTLTPRIEPPGERFVPSGRMAPVNKEALEQVEQRQTARAAEPNPPFGGMRVREGETSPTQLTYTQLGVIPGTTVETKMAPQGPLPPPPGYVPPTTAATISKDAFDVSGAHYDLADHLGGRVGATANNTFLDEKIAKIRTQTPEARRFDPTDAVDSTIADLNNGLRDSELSLRGTQEIDRKIGDRIGAALRAGKNDEASRLIQIQHALRDHVESVGQSEVTGGPEGFAALKDARKAWSIAVRMQDVERIITESQDAVNPQTAFRNKINAYLNDERMTRGWSKEDLDALRQAGKTGNGIEIMRTLGSRLGPIGGYAMGGPIGGALVGVGETILAKQMRDAMGDIYTKRLQTVLERLGRNVPGMPGSEAGPPLPPGLLERMRLGRGPAAPPGVTVPGLLGSMVIEPPQEERR